MSGARIYMSLGNFNTNLMLWPFFVEVWQDHIKRRRLNLTQLGDIFILRIHLPETQNKIIRYTEFLHGSVKKFINRKLCDFVYKQIESPLEDEQYQAKKDMALVRFHVHFNPINTCVYKLFCKHMLLLTTDLRVHRLERQLSCVHSVMMVFRPSLLRVESTPSPFCTSFFLFSTLMPSLNLTKHLYHDLYCWKVL
jgi:hypothetical protein